MSLPRLSAAQEVQRVRLHVAQVQLGTLQMLCTAKLFGVIHNSRLSYARTSRRETQAAWTHMRRGRGSSSTRKETSRDFGASTQAHGEAKQPLLHEA